MNKNRVVGIFIIISFLVCPLLTAEAIGYEAYNYNFSTTPLIIQMGSSFEVEICVKTLLNEFPNVNVVKVENKGEFSSLVPNRNAPTIYVGHGALDGLLISKSQIMEWNELAEQISESLGYFHIILSCYSYVMKQLVPNKFIYGVEGELDAIIGAYTAIGLLSDYYLRYQPNSNTRDRFNVIFGTAVNKLAKRFIGIYSGVLTPLPLYRSESGVQVAFKRNIYMPWTFLHEEILWFNFCDEQANILLIGGAGAVGPITYQIATAIVRLIGEVIVLGVELSVAWWVSLLVLLFIAVLISIRFNMSQRPGTGNDAVLGIGVQPFLIGTSSSFYKLDHGQDNHPPYQSNVDGWQSVPFWFVSIPLLAAAISLIPLNSWKIVF